VIAIDIPGRETVILEHLVLDVNGTIVSGGEVIESVPEALRTLAGSLHVVAVTADTRGMATALAEELGIEVHVIPTGEEGRSKLEYLQELGAEACVAVGNGANDALMLQTAAVGIAVIGAEGVAAGCLLAADIVTTSIGDALSLLLDPLRLAATLRG